MAYRHLTVERPAEAQPLSRRDFLRMRVSEGRQVLELSCERLFMRYHDACSGAARRQLSNHDDVALESEPLTGFDTPTTDSLLAELEQRLAEADELCVLDSGWLDGGTFGREVGARVAAFEQRGGRVSFSAATESSALGTAVEA